MKDEGRSIDGDVPRLSVGEVVIVRVSRDGRQCIFRPDPGVSVGCKAVVYKVLGEKASGCERGADLADVERVEQGAMVDCHSVICAWHDTEGGCEGIDYAVLARRDAKGDHACVGVWGNGLGDGV